MLNGRLVANILVAGVVVAVIVLLFTGVGSGDSQSGATTTGPASASAAAPTQSVPSNGHPIGVTETETQENGDAPAQAIPADSPDREQLQASLQRFAQAYFWFGTDGLTDPAAPICDPKDGKQTQPGSTLQNYLSALKAARVQRVQDLRQPADPTVPAIPITDDAFKSVQASLASPLGFTEACGLYNAKGIAQGSVGPDQLAMMNVIVQNNDPGQLFVRLPVAMSSTLHATDSNTSGTFTNTAQLTTAWTYDTASSTWVLAYFAT